MAFEYGWTPEVIRNLYDEEFHMMVTLAFELRNQRQTGMGLVGWDFRSDSQKKYDEWLSQSPKEFD